MNRTPTEVEQKAQDWHDEQVRTENPDTDSAHRFSTCWCCCVICDPDYDGTGNPHWADAQAALTASTGDGE